MEINPATKSVGELALEVPHAISIFEKWQIDYCCKGGRTVAEACDAAGVNTAELLQEIGVGRGAAEEGRQWQKETLAALQKYIVETHHAFTRDILETLVHLTDKVAMRHGPRHSEVMTVQKIVHEIYDDLIPHMLKEEQVLFPYIEQMEAAIGRGQEPPTPFFGTVQNPVRMMMAEHDAVGELLSKLRVETKEYALPEDACLSFRALYERLGDIEQDLHTHIHLENNLLFPRAASMEESVRPVPASSKGNGNGHDHGRCGCGCSH
jgi:regulator of cell morphogenesis and NO signaling